MRFFPVEYYAWVCVVATAISKHKMAANIICFVPAHLDLAAQN